MNVLRHGGAVLFVLGQVLSAVVVSALVPLCLVLPSLLRARVIGVWARFNIYTLRRLCGVTYRVSGLENLPARPSIVVANHQSTWETLGFQLIFPPQSYLLKRNLLLIPFFGWGLAANRPIAIDRAQKLRALDKLVRASRERLREGRWLVIFAEGTRMPPGKMGQFQLGAAIVASKTGAPIVPVAHNAGRFWPKHRMLKRAGTIDVVVGPVIESVGRKPRELNQQVETWVRQQASRLPQG